MINKTKRGVDLAAAIIGIIIGGLEAIGAIIIFIAAAALLTEPVYASVGIIMLILAIFDIGFCLAFIIIGAKLCKKPQVVNGAVVSRKGLDITLLVLCAIYVVFGIICFAVGNTGAIIIINLILSLITAGLKIASLCLKEQVGAPATAGIPIEQKLAELKRMKELGAISEEQYNSAVEKAIKDETK